MRIILGILFWNFDIISVDGAPNWNPENEMGNDLGEAGFDFETQAGPAMRWRCIPDNRRGW